MLVPDYDRMIDVFPGETYEVLMPYSEVCMHMGIAGTVRRILVREAGRGVYLLNADLTTGPHMTSGEAGILGCSHSHPYTYGFKYQSPRA
jgi:hypothetical protein